MNSFDPNTYQYPHNQVSNENDIRLLAGFKSGYHYSPVGENARKFSPGNNPIRIKKQEHALPQILGSDYINLPQRTLVALHPPGSICHWGEREKTALLRLPPHHLTESDKISEMIAQINSKKNNAVFNQYRPGTIPPSLTPISQNIPKTVHNSTLQTFLGQQEVNHQQNPAVKFTDYLNPGADNLVEDMEKDMVNCIAFAFPKHFDSMQIRNQSITNIVSVSRILENRRNLQRAILLKKLAQKQVSNNLSQRAQHLCRGDFPTKTNSFKNASIATTLNQYKDAEYMNRLREIQNTKLASSTNISESNMPIFPEALPMGQTSAGMPDQDETVSYSYSDSEEMDSDVKVYIQQESKRIRKLKSITQEVQEIINLELIDPHTGILGKKTRKRMNQWKIQYLEKEFAKKPDWNKRDQQRLSKKLGFEISKIYKWNWEKKKKNKVSI